MKTSHRSDRRRGGRRPGALVFAAVAVAALAMTAFAIAKSTTLGVVTAKLSGPSGMRSEPIAANSRGVAVYELLPETTHHLLCTKANKCFGFWPPVKVGSGAKLSKAAGVRGKLGTFRRNGFTQVTLNGHPLYTFSVDGGKKDVAAGDGIKGFGGTWHVFKEGAIKKAGATPVAPAPAPAPTGYTAPAATTTTTTSSSSSDW
jgi:predicted lipoprotein with Yx(FWY)xxD motif